MKKIAMTVSAAAAAALAFAACSSPMNPEGQMGQPGVSGAVAQGASAEFGAYLARGGGGRSGVALDRDALAARLDASVASGRITAESRDRMLERHDRRASGEFRRGDGERRQGGEFRRAGGERRRDGEFRRGGGERRRDGEARRGDGERRRDRAEFARERGGRRGR